MNNKSVPGSGMGSYRVPLISLLVMTLALNILSLSIPLAAQLIFNRILPAPGSSTLAFVVVGVIILAFLEAFVRLARSLLMLDASRVVTADMTRQVLSRIVESDFASGIRGSARSLDYFARINQVADKQSGRLLVGLAELMFLPIILVLIFFISPVVGGLMTACLLIGCYLTMRGATALRRSSIILSRRVERRYRFLLSILTAVHPLKALGIEDFILRRYEHIQVGIARTSMKTAQASSQLLNGVVMTNQAITATTLIYGAYAVNQGAMTLGAVSASVLLGGRLMAPLQRAVFIFIQSRDLCEAEDVLEEVMEHRPVRTVTRPVDAANEGRIDINALSFEIERQGHPERIRNLDLHVFPGETVVISGGSEQACTTLLKIMAGISRPSGGEVLLNGMPIDLYPRTQLNQSVGYVSGDAMMFYGTIRDNITRFGEVSLEQAMSVAALMDLQAAINELPRGIDTQLNGSVNENVPTGLCQQLAILRALSFRPRLLLLDNIDRGLDRLSYARLQRFLASIQGQASLIIVSDDRNLTAGAQRRMILTETGFRPDFVQDDHLIETYRSLKL